MRKILGTLLILLATSYSIFCSEQQHFSDLIPNARSIGIGGSAVALSMGPSSCYWNPASIAFLMTDKILINLDEASNLNYTGFVKYFPPNVGMGINIFQGKYPGSGASLSTIALGYRLNSAVSLGGNLNLYKRENGELFSSLGVGIFLRAFPAYHQEGQIKNPIWKWLRSRKMKDKFSFGFTFHNIPLKNGEQNQELRIGTAVQPVFWGPLLHFAYHLNNEDDHFYLGGQINLFSDTDLLFGLKDFDKNNITLGIGTKWKDFTFDLSYLPDVGSFNFSMGFIFCEDEKFLAQRYRNLGSQKVRKNDFLGGLKEYRKALAFDPEDEKLSLLISVLEKKVEERKKKVDSLFTMGQNFERKGWYVNAFLSYKQILMIDKNSKRTKKQLKSMSSKLNKYLEELYAKGVVNFQNNDINQAEIFFRKILSVTDSHKGANLYISKIDSIKSYTFSEYYYRGLGYYNQKKYKRALEELTKALALNPNDKDAKRYKELAENAIDRNQRKIKQLLKEAEKYERQNLFVKANSRYRRILQLDEQNQYARDKVAYLKRYIAAVVESKFQKAKQLYKRKEYQSAIAAFTEILSIDPGHSQSKSYLNKARAGLKKILDQHYQQALTYFDQKQYEKALEECNYILSIDNNYAAAQALQSRAYANISLKNLHEKGAQFFQKGDFLSARKIYTTERLEALNSIKEK